jgi:hypothetical protein
MPCIDVQVVRGVLDIAELSAVGRRLRVLTEVPFEPRQFLAQAPRPLVAGLWLSSAATLVSHRKLASRSQFRHLLQPSDCLLRGPDARAEWALAIPPLRPSLGQEHPLRSVRVLVEVDSCVHDDEICNLQPSTHIFTPGLPFD